MNLNGRLSYEGNVSGSLGAELVADVEANPSGPATQTLGKIRVGDIIYSIPSGGGGGTSDYNQLTNKPKINGVVLTGDKTSDDLDLSNKAHFTELSGSVVSFQDGQELPLAKCEVDINPIQDLHGYDKPWAGGAGKNKFNIDENRIGIDYDDSISLSRFWQTVSLPSGNYTISFNGNMTGISEISFGKADITLPFSSINQHVLRTVMSSSNTSLTVTIDASYPFAFIGVIKSGGSITKADIDNLQIQIETGNTATAYEPYSNICPISGHTEVTVTVSDGGGSDTNYICALGRNVYGGNVNLINGDINITKANIATYAGEELPGEWLSDRDEYEPGTMPTNGAQVVYDLNTIQTDTTTPVKVKSRAGTNEISADIGDIDIIYINNVNDPAIEFILNNL